MSTSPRTYAHTWQPLHPPPKRPPARPALARRDHPRGLRHPPVCRHAPKISHTISHNLTQSHTFSRNLSSQSLVHLYVPFTFQRIGQRDNSYRLPAARIPLRFAQCPCTQTAIRAGAVNHPHHINCANHSSNKCQPALVHALTPGNPSIRRKKATSPTRTRPPRPPARPSPSTRLPSCAQNFLPNLTQSLAISRLTLLHLYVPFTFQRIGQRDNSYRLSAARIPLRFAQCPCTQTAIRAGAVNHPHHINCANHSSNKCQPALVHALTPVNPFNRRKKASSAARAPLPRLPCFAQNFLPNLTQSLVISRRTLVHLSCLSTLQPPQKCFQDESRLKPGLCRTIKQLNHGRLAFPSAIRNTKYAIQKSGFPI